MAKWPKEAARVGRRCAGAVQEALGDLDAHQQWRKQVVMAGVGSVAFAEEEEAEGWEGRGLEAEAMGWEAAEDGQAGWGWGGEEEMERAAPAVGG